MTGRRVVIMILFTLTLGQTLLQAGGPKRYLEKETPADMTRAKNVYLGWLDMNPQDWATYGYSTEEEWKQVINELNNWFQAMCRTKYLKGRNVTGAKNATDQNTLGQDLFIKFSKVSIDYDNLYLVLGIEFIDPKTDSVLGTIPVRQYYKGIFWTPWGFERYLYNDLEEVNLKLQIEVTRRASAKVS